MKIVVSSDEEHPGRGWRVPSSRLAKETFNPIRNILETMNLRPNPRKKMISLSIGDPTVFGNLRPDEVVVEAVKESLDSGKYNGYASSVGYPEAREAVADHVSCPGAEITGEILAKSRLVERRNFYQSSTATASKNWYQQL